MAEFAMWGPEQSGPRLAQRDQQGALLNQLSALQTVGELEMLPAKKKLAESHARLYGAQAGVQEMELARSQRIAAGMPEMLSQMSQGGAPQDNAEIADRMANLYFQMGASEKGASLAASAELMRSRKARELQQQASASKAQTDAQLEQLGAVGQLSGSVTDQAGLDRMRMLGMQLAGGISDPRQRAMLIEMFDRIPLDFESAKPVLEQYSQQAIKASDKVKQEQKDRDLERREQFLELRGRIADSAERAREARREADELRARERARVGGAPTQDVATASAFIRQQLGLKDTVAVEGMIAGAAETAEKARQLMRQNSALTYTQAMAQAFDPADWPVEKNTWSADTARYAGAIPLPPGNDPKNLKAGQKYRDGGQVKTWDGKGWK